MAVPACDLSKEHRGLSSIYLYLNNFYGTNLSVTKGEALQMRNELPTWLMVIWRGTNKDFEWWKLKRVNLVGGW